MINSSKNKKIILFTDSLGAGGAQRQLVGLAVMLKEVGYSVTVATYHNLDFYKSQLDEMHVRNVLIPDAENSKKRIMAVRSFFKHENPDCVIAYQETPSLVACLARVAGCKFRLIVSERNTTQIVGANERIRFFLYRWAYAIVPNSYAQQFFLSTHYTWMKCKIKTITNFVDIEYFNFEEKIKRDVPEIVVVATIWQPKNTIGLIEAARMLVANGLRFHISWYGKSASNIEYYNECLQRIQKFELEEYIALKEKTKNIKQIYKGADFFCLPSFYEGTPNVLCEAMSCGRPIICSAVCDNPIYVKEGENGFLFNPRETKAIANALEKALAITDDKYSIFCKQSREKAERLLSQKTFVDKYIKIIEDK